MEKGKTEYPCRETGAPGRSVLVVAAWQTEDRALRAVLARMKELIPCTFDILNLESPTAERYSSDRALYDRMRRYDAVVVAVSARDGERSPALRRPAGRAASAHQAAPGARLPMLRCFTKRIPAVYITDGAVTPALAAAARSHARLWHLLHLGAASDDDSLTKICNDLIDKYL